MKKTIYQIIVQIRGLLNELESASTETSSTAAKGIKDGIKKTTGCIGAIQELIDEGFFDEPKSMPQIMDKLKKRGQTSFTSASVSMNLLNLVKPPRRILDRDGTSKKWVYFKK